MPPGEGKEAPREVTTKSAYTAALYSLPLLFLFWFLGKFETGIVAAICSTVVLWIVRIRWDLRKHVWFWVTISFAMLLQVPVVLLIPWNDRTLNRATLFPGMVLDYCLVYGAIKLVEKLMTKRDGAGS